MFSGLVVTVSAGLQILISNTNGFSWIQELFKIIFLKHFKMFCEAFFVTFSLIHLVWITLKVLSRFPRHLVEVWNTLILQYKALFYFFIFADIQRIN